MIDEDWLEIEKRGRELVNTIIPDLLKRLPEGHEDRRTLHRQFQRIRDGFTSEVYGGHGQSEYNELVSLANLILRRVPE